MQKQPGRALSLPVRGPAYPQVEWARVSLVLKPAGAAQDPVLSLHRVCSQHPE